MNSTPKTPLQIFLSLQCTSRKFFGKSVLAICTVFLLPSSGMAALADEGSGDIIEVDTVWSGISAQYSAVSVGSYVYVSYYDSDREFTVAKVNTVDGTVQKKRLGSRFLGWDNHNSTVTKYDRFGYLHVAGNMHASPLVYGRMLKPADFDSFARVKSMVGDDETSVTYPKFFDLHDGSLGFTYRSGKSGDGVEIVDRFDGKSWRRYLDKPVFAPDLSGPRVSAYYGGYMAGPDGAFHVAWTWRLSKMAETNFNVNYARSNDLLNWFDSKGRPVSLPITPSSADTADEIPPNSGIYNNVKVGFDASKTPVISYLKYDKNGFTQLFHARPKDGKWEVRKITDWTYRWDFGGAGTLVEKIYFSGVAVKGGQVVETIRHPIAGNLTAIYDKTALEVQKFDPILTKRSTACKNARPWSQAEVNINPATADSYRGKIVWRAMGRDNNDQPRSCVQIGLGDNCVFSSKLFVVPATIAETSDGATLACNK